MEMGMSTQDFKYQDFGQGFDFTHLRRQRKQDLLFRTFVHMLRLIFWEAHSLVVVFESLVRDPQPGFSKSSSQVGYISARI